MATFTIAKYVSGVTVQATITYSVSSTSTQTTLTVSKVAIKQTHTASAIAGITGVSLGGAVTWAKTYSSVTGSDRTETPNKTATWSRSTSDQSKTLTATLNFVLNGQDSATGSATITVPALASYAVKYAANGGSSTPSQQTKYYGRSLTLAAAISHANTTPTSYKVTYNYNGSGQAATSATANVTRKWTFSKWKASDGTQYNGGGSYTANAATTMTAQWTTSDSTAQLTLPTPNARTGYTFAGWYTAASGGTSKGAAGAKFTPTAATTLYAHWTGNSYAVNYNANGGTGAPSAQTRTYGTALTLSTTKPTRIGHTFLGWATTASAKAAQYAPGASYNPSTAAATTLYAVWKSNYAAPKITSLTAVRCNSSGTADDEGTYAKVTAAWSTMQSIDQNKTANYGTVTGKTRASDASSDVSFTFSSGAGGTGVYSGTAVAIVPNMSTEKSYSVTVSVTDAQGGKTTVRSTLLTSAKFILDFKAGGEGIGIGAAAPDAGLAIGKPTTMTSELKMANANIKLVDGTIDRDAENPSSDQWGNGAYRLYDKDGDLLGYFGAVRRTNGRIQCFIATVNELSDGTQSQSNTFFVGVEKDGTKHYGAADPAKFRSDLGITPANIGAATASHTHSAGDIDSGTLPVGRGGTGQTGVTKSTLTQAQAFDSVTSGVTVSNVYVAKWGEVMTLQVTFKYSSALAANESLTIGTLKSAYRPAYIVGGGSHNFVGYVSNNGAVTVRNVTGSSLSANTDRWVGFTFVLA